MVATKNKLEVSLPGDTSILMTRVFEAPRELVFECHTTPEHVRNWWGMRGSTLSICEIDFRVGGKWRWAIDQGPDVDDVTFYGEYREIEQPARIVNTEVYEPFPEFPSLVTVTLEDLGEGRCLYTSLAEYPSQEVRDMVIESGMEAGAAESLDRLEEHAISLAG